MNFITKWILRKEFEKMGKLWNALSGKKAYLLCLAQFIYALSAAATGHITWQEAFNLIMQSGILAAIRHGISTNNK